MRPFSLQRPNQGTFPLQSGGTTLMREQTQTPSRTFSFIQSSSQPTYEQPRRQMQSPSIFNQQFTVRNDKKRDLSEMQQHRNDYQRFGLGTPKSPNQLFEDSSTVKPSDNTIIRNPTLFQNVLESKPQLNRSHHIQPMNLSKIEFDKKPDNDTFSQHQRTAYFKERLRDKHFTIKEVSDFCMRVSLIINDMMNSESDLKITSLEHARPDGRMYEIVPHSFVVHTQHKIPQAIRQELMDQASENKKTITDYGFLDDEQVAYFTFDRNLYLWMFPSQSLDQNLRPFESIPSKFTMNHSITSVSMAQPLPGMDYKDDSKILIISTLEEIKIFKYTKNQRELKVDLVDTKFSLPTDQQIINKIAQVQKNGRVFYGGNTGHINELKYEQATKFDIFGLLLGERKKLKKNNFNEQSLISKLIPSFFKVSDKKSVIDIKIDEHRNILYAVSMSTELNSQGDTIIEVYDLGLLCNKFAKIATITQQHIVESMLEFWQKDKSAKKPDLKKLTQEHKIVYVEPISVAESEKWHLMLVTQNGYRIYVGFIAESALNPPDEDLKDNLACSDYLHLERPTKKWNIMEILHLPDQTSYQDLNFINQKQSMFNGGTLQSVSQNPGFDNDQVHYNSYDGVLAFVQSNPGKGSSMFHDVEFADRHVINVVKRNESMISFRKQLVEGGSITSLGSLIPENYSQVHIPFEKVEVRAMHTPNQLRVDEHVSYVPESVIQIQTRNNVVNLEEQKLLGLRKLYRESKTQNATPNYDSLSLSEFEKQAYLLPLQMNILTDTRVIQLQHLRPIDILSMIVSLMVDPKQQNKQLFNFEEFADSYSIRETCGMLLQIILDKDLYFIHSRRFEEQLVKQQQGDINQNVGAGQFMSKSTQIMRQSKRTSMFQAKDQTDTIRFRKLSTDTRKVALELLKKYGDCVLRIRQIYELPKESVEGVPVNLQDFSLKHYVLYQYLQRVMRPIWSIKVGYHQPKQSDKFYRCSYESLNVPRSKLCKLLEFVNEQDLDLCGENYTVDMKLKESFFKIPDLLQIAKPVFQLPQTEKNKLELMEKNSLKNLKQFINRCIEGIDLLNILTKNFDQKFFEAVQKQLDNFDLVKEFCDTTFKELVTLENNVLFRRVLEASVQVETSGSLEAQSKMRKIYGNINQICGSYFSLSENITFIGITLLQAAKREKSIQRKEELLKQAVDHLSDQPINIDMSVVPYLLVDNGNYTTLADLALRKLRALQQLKLEERERIMTKQDYDAAKDECYSILLSLFAAIDQSITKIVPPPSNNRDEQDQIAYFLQKLNVVEDNTLKLHLRDKIMKRIELFNDEVVMSALFDYLISRPNTPFNINALPNLSEKSLFKICDQVIQEVNVPRYKFDAVVQILMKKKEAERLMNLAKNACYDQYKIAISPITKVALTLQEKYNLVHTAQIILEDQRGKFTQDLYQVNHRQMQDLKDTIESQIMVVQNISEMIELLKKGGSKQVDYINQLSLTQLNLESKVITKEEQYKECCRAAINESSIRFSLNRIDKGDKPLTKVENDIDSMISFFLKFSSSELFNKLASKIQLFQGRNDYLKYYLSKSQNALDGYFQPRSSPEKELKILQTDKQFTGTRFQLFAYSFSFLINDLPPSALYRLFCPQSKFMTGEGPFQTEQDLGSLITQMALVKCWIYLNENIFGQDQAPQLIELVGSQDVPTTFQKDLKNNYTQIVRQIKQVQSQITDDLVMMLPKMGSIDVGNTLKQLHNEIDQQFMQMLGQHQIDPNIPSGQQLNNSFFQAKSGAKPFAYSASKQPHMLPGSAQQSSLNYSSVQQSQQSLSEESKNSIDQQPSSQRKSLLVSPAPTQAQLRITQPAAFIEYPTQSVGFKFDSQLREEESSDDNN